MESIFTPQKYRIEDKIGEPFIDRDEIYELLEKCKNSSQDEIDSVIETAKNKQRLTLEQCAILIGATDNDSVNKIFKAAQSIKKEIYGERIVLFAPLYVGNLCSNHCTYCGFNVKNSATIRKTLTSDELRLETEALLAMGHKRTILVFGEHRNYSAQYIASCVKEVYSVERNGDSIRRININAAPLSTEDFRVVKEAGIGTYQVFQETYDPGNYKKYHLSGKKSDYNYRLTSLDRAMDAGIDDVGIGALIGLGDPFFELMAMVRHANHLEACYNVGPHTVSFPRIKLASGVDHSSMIAVSDEEFLRFIAILRLAIPYAGMILTAREDERLRHRAMSLGVSQIDGGTKIEIGGYTAAAKSQNLDKEQFIINDERSLSSVIDDLTQNGYIPSFCTSCYRKNRTGEHFMEFCVKGFIKRYCTPNALFTYAEYLENYGSEKSKAEGYSIINSKIGELEEAQQQKALDVIARIKDGERDLLF